MHKLCQRVKHFEEPLTLKKAIPPPATAFVLREDDEVSQVKPLEQITGRVYTDRSENILEILMKKDDVKKKEAEKVQDKERKKQNKNREWSRNVKHEPVAGPSKDRRRTGHH